jgi:hypothetical protein
LFNLDLDLFALDLQQIVQILCSHIRSKTNEVAYQETHEEHPSNEIQTTLNLLFKEHERGLYTQDFAKVAGFPRAFHLILIN